MWQIMWGLFCNMGCTFLLFMHLKMMNAWLRNCLCSDSFFCWCLSVEENNKKCLAHLSTCFKILVFFFFQNGATGRPRCREPVVLLLENRKNWAVGLRAGCAWLQDGPDSLRLSSQSFSTWQKILGQFHLFYLFYFYFFYCVTQKV